VRPTFLPRVVAALETTGVTVAQHAPADRGRGDPATWTMSAPIDRQWIEERFDLGPLAWWYVGPRGGWTLVDQWSQGSLAGVDEPVAYDPDGVDRMTADRWPLGHVAAAPELRRRWPVPSATDELGVLDGGRIDVRGHSQAAHVTVDGAPAEVVHRVREVLTVVLEGLTGQDRLADVAAALPAWFVEASAPTRTPDEWVAWADRAYADMATVRLRRWEARWTTGAWLLAMLPHERTWWLADVSVDAGGLELAVLTPSLGAPVSSLEWLLHVAGATACGPPTTPAEHGPLVLPVLPPDLRRDADDALAAAAHELLGLPDPLVLEALPGPGGPRWQHRVDVPLDMAALDHGLPSDTPLEFRTTGRSTVLTNGVSSVVGTVPVRAVVRRVPWWGRLTRAGLREHAARRKPARVIRDFFARHLGAHLVLPDGWVGRPYDEYVLLASVIDDGRDLTMRFTTGESLVVWRGATVRDVGGSLLVSVFERAVFHPAASPARTFRRGTIELVGVGSQRLGEAPGAGR
jgi:hypothetical protein